MVTREILVRLFGLNWRPTLNTNVWQDNMSPHLSEGQVTHMILKNAIPEATVPLYVTKVVPLGETRKEAKDEKETKEGCNLRQSPEKECVADTVQKEMSLTFPAFYSYSFQLLDISKHKLQTSRV